MNSFGRLQILISGQLRTAEKVWPLNKKTLLIPSGQQFKNGFEETGYDIYLVTSNTDLKSSVRRTNEETEELARRIYGPSLKAIKIIDDISMADNGSWTAYSKIYPLKEEMYDHGTNAFYPPSYGFDLSYELDVDSANQLVEDLKTIHPRYRDDIRYKNYKKPYLTPLSGRELQFDKRACVWELFKANNQEVLMPNVFIATRPDFLFEPRVVPDIFGRIFFSSDSRPKLYTYPLNEYRFSDVFAIGDYAAMESYCSRSIFQNVRITGYQSLSELVKNLVSKSSNPNACENIHSYFALPERTAIQHSHINNNTTMFISNIIR